MRSQIAHHCCGGDLAGEFEPAPDSPEVEMQQPGHSQLSSHLDNRPRAQSGVEESQFLQQTSPQERTEIEIEESPLVR